MKIQWDVASTIARYVSIFEITPYDVPYTKYRFCHPTLEYRFIENKVDTLFHFIKFIWPVLQQLDLLYGVPHRYRLHSCWRVRT
jgi:hypothetical protein